MHLCAMHSSKQYHTCPSSHETTMSGKSQSTTKYQLLSRVNTHELVRLATHLNNDGQLHHTHPLEAFLFYDFLRTNSHALLNPDIDIPGQYLYFLKHVVDKGDHLLVEEDYSITGIIDWQYSRRVPASEALGPSYITADFEGLYSDKASLSDDDQIIARGLRERGFEALAEIAEGCECIRRFHHWLASGLSRDGIQVYKYNATMLLIKTSGIQGA
ncbi:uncharacterized protein BDV17DRAFT_292139 [Aspergillus undulatus]|uniref:uncharacterized protein n=1 Tax=Aspergillus undulatus TaxID=1810928 RepID=UPI003CCCB89D